MTAATNRLEDVWNSIDYPVLAEVARQLRDQPGRSADHRAVATAPDMSPDDVISAMVRLDGSYLMVKTSGALGGRIILASANAITDSGLREVEMWPSPEEAADRLIAALEALIDNTAEGSPTQGRLKAARDGLLAAGRDVVVEVAGATISGRIPMGWPRRVAGWSGRSGLPPLPDQSGPVPERPGGAGLGGRLRYPLPGPPADADETAHHSPTSLRP